MPKVISPLTDAQRKKHRYGSKYKAANRIRDGRGLILEARPSGEAVWRYENKLGKKRSYTTLPHRYGTERGTLAEARKWREELRALLAAGIGPNEHAKQQRANRLADSDRIFYAVANDWIAFKEDAGKWGSKQQKKLQACSHTILSSQSGYTVTHQISLLAGRIFKVQRAHHALLKLIWHAGHGSWDNTALSALALSKMNWNNDALYDYLPVTMSYAKTLVRIIKRMDGLGSLPYQFRFFMWREKR